MQQQALCQPAQHTPKKFHQQQSHNTHWHIKVTILQLAWRKSGLKYGNTHDRKSPNYLLMGSRRPFISLQNRHSMRWGLFFPTSDGSVCYIPIYNLIASNNVQYQPRSPADPPHTSGNSSLLLFSVELRSPNFSFTIRFLALNIPLDRLAFLLGYTFLKELKFILLEGLSCWQLAGENSFLLLSVSGNRLEFMISIYYFFEMNLVSIVWSFFQVDFADLGEFNFLGVCRFWSVMSSNRLKYFFKPELRLMADFALSGFFYCRYSFRQEVDSSSAGPCLRDSVISLARISRTQAQNQFQYCFSCGASFPSSFFALQTDLMTPLPSIFSDSRKCSAPPSFFSQYDLFSIMVLSGVNSRCFFILFFTMGLPSGCWVGVEYPARSVRLLPERSQFYRSSMEVNLGVDLAEL